MEITINTNIEEASETVTDLPENKLLIEDEILDLENYLMKNEDDSSLTISDDENEYIVELSLPGFEPDDISLEIENHILYIAAKSETEKIEDTNRFTSNEITYNSYYRSFKLPGNLEDEKLVAEYINGILTLTFPKVEISSLEPGQESLLL